MNRCPITYDQCSDRRYSEKGLRLLYRSLKNLKEFPYTAKEQIELATRLAMKLSIQGVQPKLSVRLNPASEGFDIVESGGTFILKPPHQIYEELPQNEDVTMRLAETVGIEVPLHGMIYNIDDSLTYFIKRFDRLPRGRKIATEDFSQLLGYSRDTKYESSMEKLIPVIEKHCTFPLLEKIKLFRRTIFNFLVGNEDMHLKNFSLIRYQDKTELSPAYDLINSSMVLQSGEEIALPLRGKKSKLTLSDLVDYFGAERLGIPAKVLEEEMQKFENAFAVWEAILEKSFLTERLRDSYLELIAGRRKRLHLSSTFNRPGKTSKTPK